MSFDVKGATSLLDLENIWIEKSQVVTVQPKKKSYSLSIKKIGWNKTAIKIRKKKKEKRKEKKKKRMLITEWSYRTILKRIDLIYIISRSRLKVYMHVYTHIYILN